MNQKILITILVSCLVLVVGVSVAILYWLPTDQTTTSASPAASLTPAASPAVVTTSAASLFSTAVLDRSDYQALDQKLIQQGSIPVQPPQGIGKANPFL